MADHGVFGDDSPVSQLVVLAWLSTIVSTTLVFVDPWGLIARESHSSSLANVLAIASESFAVPALGVSIAVLLQRRAKRMGQFLSVACSLLPPLLMLLEALTWRWIGQHLISQVIWQTATQKGEGLLGHLSFNIALGLGTVFILAVVVAVVMWYVSRVIGRTWDASRRLPQPSSAYLASLLCLALASLLLWQARAEVRLAMRESPFQHPLCVLGVVRPASSIVAATEPRLDTTEPRIAPADDGFASRVLARQTDQRLVTISQPPSRELLPDGLIVVIESFRRELVTAEVMPNLAAFADHAIQCRSHFSGGNATNLGVFSLVNGLEAIWHDTPVRYSPLMNRLLHQAGYELGFFGGHNDWRKFQMDGYISPEQFDQFEIDAPGGLSSDRQTIQLAAKFLQPRGADEPSRRPRLAMLYLYATHAPYESYVDDQVFQPAADDRFIIPYTPSSRDQVWNRYRNSAHSVDRMLKSLLREDRVVIVTGDHGESFLDDASIGHGVRLSEFQNMTSAIFSAPGVTPRKIDVPTMHADLLPTLLAAIGITVSDAAVFDGDNLLAAIDTQLRDRIFATRDYLQDDVALIGRWTNRVDEPFAFRASVSLHPFHARPLAAINASGRELEISSTVALAEWLEIRFGKVE